MAAKEETFRVTIDLDPTLYNEFKKMARILMEDDAPGIDQIEDVGEIVNMALATAVDYLHEVKD